MTLLSAAERLLLKMMHHAPTAITAAVAASDGWQLLAAAGSCLEPIYCICQSGASTT
jgi:hypothetical protein